MRPTDLPRVLVIEDRASIRELLCGLFTMLGYDAQPACDGVEALGWLRQAPYDLVVTDLTMPGASGWDVIDAVRRHAPGTPVIIVTGTATDADRHRARQQAAVILDKPFRIEPFRAAVDRALSPEARRVLSSGLGKPVSGPSLGGQAPAHAAGKGAPLRVQAG